ncbi:MAG: arsenate reductase (glutaredoxin) [Chlorobi bacterium]|nr:arsenate reductase (glutaredoxin) [Chlorobiota bacterium]
MDKAIIWHNPRCRKSREGLKMLEELAAKHGVEIEIRKYLDNPPTPEELKEVLRMMNAKPEDILRKQEKIWKEQFKGKTFTEDELIRIMAEHPKLIERPIVIYKGKAVLGRPAENIKALFE